MLAIRSSPVIEVSSSIEIDRPADEVFAFVADFPNNVQWQRGQRECTWTSEPPLRVGSTYDQRARFLGRDMVNSFEVIGLEPGRRVEFTSTGGTFPLTIIRTAEPLADGRARFTEHVRGEPGGFFRIAEPVLKTLVRASIKRDLPRLRQILERGGR